MFFVMFLCANSDNWTKEQNDKNNTKITTPQSKQEQSLRRGKKSRVT